MSNTTSLAFPNMLDVTRNRVSILSDEASVVNRTRLLMLTEPTELYNEINFGAGMKRHLWQYNTENEKQIIKNRIIDQLRLHEPYCIPDETSFADGLLFTSNSSPESQNYNELDLTVGVSCTFGGHTNIDI